MHPAIDNFLERPMSHKVAFWVGSLAFFAFIFWIYFYSPKRTEIEKLTEKHETLQTQVAQEERLARNLDKFRKEVKELDLKLEGALRELPDQREIPDLLSSISGLARDAGLEVGLFKPKGENFKEFYAEVPVDISVEGTFHQVATFFDEVGRLPRIVNISNINIREPKVSPESVLVKTDCVATTFRYLDDNERNLQSKKGDSKRRRK